MLENSSNNLFKIKFLKFKDINQDKINKIELNYVKNYLKLTKLDNFEEKKEFIDKLFCYLNKIFEKILSKYNEDLVKFAYQQLETVEFNRDFATIGLNLYYNLGDINNYVLFNRNIIESKLRINKSGNAKIDNISKPTKIFELKYGNLLYLSKRLLELSIVSDNLYYKTDDYSINLTDYEIIIKEIDTIYDNQKFKAKFFKYHKNKNIKKILDTEKPKNVDKSEQELIEESNKDSSELDRAFSRDFGFDYNDMRSVLLGLSFHDKDEFPKIYVMNLKELRKLILKNFETLKIDVKEDNLDKVLNFLTLNSDNFNTSISEFRSKIYRSKYRLELCPLIKMYDAYVFGQTVCETAFKVWTNSINSGKEPFLLEKDSKLRKVLEQFRFDISLEFEVECKNEAKKCVGSEFVKFRIKKFHRISKKLEDRPSCGEIDLLVANPKTKNLFVFDSKNANYKFLASTIKYQFKKIYGKEKSYVEKLNKKFNYVKKHKKIFLESFKITNLDGWLVRKAFIASQVHQAAFKAGNDVDFILLDEMKDYLETLEK